MRKKLDPTNPRDIEHLRRMHPDFDEVMLNSNADYRSSTQSDASFGAKFRIPPIMEPQHKFKEHQNSVDAVCWSPDPDVFISASHDTTLKVWDARRGLCTDTLVGHVAGVYHCAVASNGRLVISCGAGDTKNVLVWSWPSKQICNSLHGHKRGVTHATFSTDSMSAATIDQEGNLIVHDIMRGIAKCETSPHNGAGHGSSFCVDDPNLICTVGGDGYIQLLDLREQIYPEVWRMPSVVANAVALHPPRLGIAGAHDGHDVYACEYVDRNTIFTGGADHKMKRWDLRVLSKGKTKCSREYLGHSGSVRSLAVSPDQRFAVSGCEDGSLRIWPKDSLQEVRSALKGLKAEVKQVEDRLNQDLPAEEQRALRSRREEIQGRLPSLRAEEEQLKRAGCIHAVRTLTGHSAQVSACVWKDNASSMGASILSSSWDQTIQLFNIDYNNLV